jgi:RimJ/RimL family protein N-acetyltransferase
MFEPLKLCDLQDILSLQDVVQRDLAAQEKSHYIVPRNRDYFMAHLQPPHRIIGLRDGNDLIAQAIFRAPREFHLHDETGLLNLDQKDLSRVSILQGALVHPKSRGRNIMHEMIKTWETWSRQQNIHHLLARTEVTHRTSANIFTSCGFKICGIVPDARDGASVHVWLKTVETS